MEMNINEVWDGERWNGLRNKGGKKMRIHGRNRRNEFVSEGKAE